MVRGDCQNFASFSANWDAICSKTAGSKHAGILVSYSSTRRSAGVISRAAARTSASTHKVTAVAIRIAHIVRVCNPLELSRIGNRRQGLLEGSPSETRRLCHTYNTRLCRVGISGRAEDGRPGMGLVQTRQTTRFGRQPPLAVLLFAPQNR